MCSELYERLEHLIDLECKWYIMFETEEGESYSFPLKTLPENFYESVMPNGAIKLENVHKVVDISSYDLEGNTLCDVKIIENVLPKLAKSFHNIDCFSKTIHEHREHLKAEIQKFEYEYNAWMNWVAECNSDERLVCRECRIPLYNSREHFESSQVHFIICENCSHIPCGTYCSTKGCANHVNRNMVSGKPYEKCFNCFNISRA